MRVTSDLWYQKSQLEHSTLAGLLFGLLYPELPAAAVRPATLYKKQTKRCSGAGIRWIRMGLIKDRLIKLSGSLFR